ncbi:MAG TPA: twin-arginine translocase TatA/TatE family subunit [Gammaproteobacteria bacterium]|jgi:sec-independent protein translocase protein TatA|nr:twin-arginine translocase TatA/TatE family subunit [Gammaproteobacteria bacterium]
MGFRGFGSLLLVFLIVMLMFGTHRLREIGNDLAGAIRNFRKGLQEDEHVDVDQDKNKKNNAVEQQP